MTLNNHLNNALIVPVSGNVQMTRENMVAAKYGKSVIGLVSILVAACLCSFGGQFESNRFGNPIDLGLQARNNLFEPRHGRP